MTNAASIESSDRTTRLIPGGAASLAQLTDEELLANTRRLVGKSNQLLAALLLHLAEVEVRGVHRTKRCASLYTYCIYELRFSEDAAARRSAAARFVKRFPALLDAVADGELHLTGLLMIGPHLTPENQAEVLGRSRFRTKKELAKLIRELNPLPGVPDLVQPLGPTLMMKTLRTPTWAEFVESFCPTVRELPPGERPRDWANDGISDDGAADRELPVGPVPANLPPIASPQRYQLQFSTVEEHVELVERAKALMARERPGVSLGELHLEAMKLLVTSLEKRKFAAGASPEPRHRAAKVPEPRQRGDHDPSLRQHGDQVANRHGRSRHVPAAIRREVYERDAARCSYVDNRGERCCETRYLELHHLAAFAQGGTHHAANLALRCAAHNRLAAEQDFGQALVTARSDAVRHESLWRQEVDDSGAD
jgi:5-methylcytosine-specific restriction endonuclease McrA